MGRATAWVRRLTWSAVGAGLLAFSCGETPADDRAVPQRITPAELSLVGTGDASHAWRLFDRDVTTGFTPQGFFGHSTVRVSLRRPTHLAFLKVHGPANVSLQAKLDDGSEVTAETDLSTLTPGWHAIPVMTSHAVTALSLHFRQHEPAPGAPEATGAADDGTEGAHTNGGSAVPEVEIWGLGPTPSALSGYVVENNWRVSSPCLTTLTTFRQSPAMRSSLRPGTRTRARAMRCTSPYPDPPQCIDGRGSATGCPVRFGRLLSRGY
ncbi:MAG TPA: hypothetical protein PKA88_17435 [Polyangiaceae bacterium]|nr:hypothetical protein [Polyangiaceae bacterium]